MDEIEAGYVSYTPTAERFAQVGADFDSEAVDDAILAHLNARVAPGIRVHRNGKVFADPPELERAKAVDWKSLLEEIDLDQLIADNPPRR
ncbi:hypothetical protein ET445_02335 [Agromyces protaetiae]|uniref:Uncharacterized protein n=1 Tax=Agromyces protaetiae TaxID=2509455 RepID=A0A4P6F9V1_9MICO|nr:hypothetical protein [Agromyces protaetiae]QAY72346.1 hypothetical protein ET445_02335 [Agromyces protaetiae]